MATNQLPKAARDALAETTYPAYFPDAETYAMVTEGDAYRKAQVDLDNTRSTLWRLDASGYWTNPDTQRIAQTNPSARRETWVLALTNAETRHADARVVFMAAHNEWARVRLPALREKASRK